MLPTPTDRAPKRRCRASRALRDLRVEWHGRTLGGFTFSAGVAVLGRHGRGFSDLLSAADRAMYDAKEAGRNRIFIADPSRQLF